eukprot:GSMAST32.ASY1.ANO1.511.1 assembled CDS
MVSRYPMLPRIVSNSTNGCLRYMSSQKKPTSFIEKAALKGANALLGKFFSFPGRFDSVFTGLQIDRIERNKVECSIQVTEKLLNSFGTLHGGATSTLIDIVGTLALLSVNPLKPGVSVELNTSFCSPAKTGETIKIEGRVLKSGKTLGFTEVKLKVGDRLIATGRHTKAL